MRFPEVRESSAGELSEPLSKLLTNKGVAELYQLLCEKENKSSWLIIDSASKVKILKCQIITVIKY